MHMGLGFRKDHISTRNKCLQKFFDYFGRKTLRPTVIVVKRNTKLPKYLDEQILLNEDGSIVVHEQAE